MDQRKTLVEKIKAAGPGAVITSAFIGPGTITTATNAGVNFGYALLWAVVFSGIASIVIMNMASRIAIFGKQNVIASSIDMFSRHKAWKYFIYTLVTLVVILTGFGFESGNLIGATTGLSDLTGMSTQMAALIAGGISLLFVISSTPKLVEIIMQLFVALMGIIFVVTAILVKPDFGAVLGGLIPSIPDGGMVTTIALIGTTIIAINLVFHSVASEEKWAHDQSSNEETLLEDAYFDSGMNVSLGVLMTLGLIITTSATLFGTGTEVTSPIVFVESLEPILGTGARMFGATGLLLAGLSSSIATPYMCGHITRRIFNWTSPDDKRPKMVAAAVVLFGTALSYFGTTPVPIILFAQAVSGVSLPIISVLFLLAANRSILGERKNTTWQNVLGVIVLIVMFFLGGRTVLSALSNLFA